MPVNRYWIAWLLLTGTATAYLVFAVRVPDAEARRVLLPGQTTHGHYQIELACNACHTEFMGVKQDACLECHGADLKRDRDTHRASKFNDPTNADRLAILNAQDCVTCHREHVPDRTHEMGLSLPADFCFHCHEDVAEQRPSHIGMKHDTCQNAGCHNYHDNSALYEAFLNKNVDQQDLLDGAVVPHRFGRQPSDEVQQLLRSDADAPPDLKLRPIVDDWADSAHAAMGVNCRGCHEVVSEDEHQRSWLNAVDHEACSQCHENEVAAFMKGRHGMRLALSISPMTPRDAKLPMHHESSHKTLDCSACHKPHRYDTSFAAAEACMTCHADQHSLNYANSKHYELWQDEMSGKAPHGSGVSCATCHMPRTDIDGRIRVQHNQNNNLRPNEKMIRGVCMNCHGLEFSLNSLADSELIEQCFAGAPKATVESAQMAKQWFEEKENKRQSKRRE